MDCRGLWLNQAGDSRRIVLDPADFAQLGFITRQMHGFMCKRQRLCGQQNAEQQQPYSSPD